MFPFMCRRSHTGGGDTPLLKGCDRAAACDTQPLSCPHPSLLSLSPPPPPSSSPRWPCTPEQKGKSLRSTACWFLFVGFNNFLVRSDRESEENQATVIPGFYLLINKMFSCNFSKHRPPQKTRQKQKRNRVIGARVLLGACVHAAINY